MESALIVRLTWVGVCATAAFVWWQLSPRNRSPVVDLRVLKDRGLTGAVIVSFVTGIGMYAGLFLFPLYSQAILGFTPTRSGTFMIVPGLVLGFGMLFTGVLMQKGVPARDLAIAGAVVTIASMWMLGHLSSQSNETDAQFGMDVRSVGLALLLFPVTVAGVVNLTAKAVPQGAALLGLARQMGGSIGIAVTATYVVNMTVFHRFDIASKLYNGNPLAEDRLSLFTGALYFQGMDQEHARKAALSLLDGQISQQAYTMAFNNAYILIGLLFVVSLPCLLLLRRVVADVQGSAH
jgi:DHA2 family multidrug resistance protein